MSSNILLKNFCHSMPLNLNKHFITSFSVSIKIKSWWDFSWHYIGYLNQFGEILDLGGNQSSVP